MVKKIGDPPKKKAMTKAELEQVLIDNFINLQKVLTNLSMKFDELSSNMSKMLQLFEISAKSFTEKNKEEEPEKKEINKSDKALLNKLDSLLDQNKTIAKGIVMMEDKIKQRTPRSTLQNREPPNFSKFKSRPLPRV